MKNLARFSLDSFMQSEPAVKMKSEQVDAEIGKLLAQPTNEPGKFSFFDFQGWFIGTCMEMQKFRKKQEARSKQKKHAKGHQGSEHCIKPSVGKDIHVKTTIFSLVEEDVKTTIFSP